MNRRDVLKSAAITVVVGGVGPIAFFGGRSARATAPGYDREHFEALVDRRFYVGHEAHPTLALLEVAPGPVAPGVDQFTLRFRGVRGLELPEGTHRLRPEDGESLDLYLAPAGEDTDGPLFAAAFCLTTFETVPGCAGANAG